MELIATDIFKAFVVDQLSTVGLAYLALATVLAIGAISALSIK